MQKDLRLIIERFLIDNEIAVPGDLYQSDLVIEALPDFVEGLAKEIGWFDDVESGE